MMNFILTNFIRASPDPMLIKVRMILNFPAYGNNYFSYKNDLH